MIVSGILLAPDATPWRNQSVRITSVLTSASVLKSADAQFVTAADGAYNVEVPNGNYRVSVAVPGRGYVDIGQISVGVDTVDSTINDLLLAQATTVPRDPLLDQILQAIADGGGSGGRQRFTWPQNIAATVWTIPHNMDTFPSVTVVDSTGARVEPDVSYVDANIVQVTHGSPFTGKAFLN